GLNRSDTDVPLTDRDRNRFAGVPFRFVNALLPRFRRYQAGILVRQIDACPSSQSHHLGVLRNPADTEIVPNVIKKHVAGTDDRLVQTYRAMAVVFIAREAMTVEGRIAWTIQRAQGVQCTGF